MVHIGLLEDNTRIAKLCATMLQYAGHRVTVYNHPWICLESLLPDLDKSSLSVLSLPALPSLPLPGIHTTRVVDALIDVLIMDLHLPDITGIDVLRVLLNQPQTQRLPLIFCTAATSTEIASALSLAPHALCIEKPFTFQELSQAINSVLHAG